MNKHVEYNQDRLETIRRARTRLRASGLLLNLGAVALAALLTVALLDYWLLLPAGVRAVGAAALLGFSAFGLVNLVRWWRRPVSLKQIALEVEARRPELGCLVSTAAEHLDESEVRAGDYAPELVATLQEHSARRLLQVETDWYHRELRRSATGFGAAALALAAFLVTAPAATQAILRALAPWKNVAYTQIEVSPGNVETPVGENQAVTAGFTGRLPKDPQLEWRRAGDPRWQVIAMLPDTENGFLQVLENVKDDLVYRVRGAQALSPEYRIATYVPPGLEGVEIEIEYPAYTGLSPASLHQPNVTVVRGSRLRWTVATSGDIAQARMRFASLPGFDLKPASADTWSGGFTPKQDLYYWIDLLDHQQRRGGSSQPFQVAVVPDEKPKADVIEPGSDIRANPLEVVPLSIDVSDDFGLKEARLVVRKMDGTTRTFPLQLEAAGTREAKLGTSIDLAPFKLKPYELLSYQVEVSDNNTLDGPGIGKSPVYFIEYTTGEKALSDCNGTGSGQRVNLLVLQKQIIASTMAIPEDNPPDKFADLAGIQRQTKKYADIFREAYQLAIAPAKAREEYDAALREMEGSANDLDELAKGPALAHQEKALQHLYEVCRLLPECEAGMCSGSGNCFKIYLEAIEKLKQETRKEREASLKAALAQAKELERRQRELVDIYRQQLVESPDGDPGRKDPKDGKEGVNARGQSGAVAGRNGGTGNPTGEPKAPQELSETQRKLAEKAAEIARLLEELSGRDARVSHRYGQMFAQAAGKLNRAGGSAGVGNYYEATQLGSGGISVIGEAIYALERIYDESTVVADLSSEAYPKAFEDKINAYLKTLSYAE